MILAGGIIPLGASSIVWRKVNCITRNLGINAIAHGIPAPSLMWLFVSGWAGVPRWDHLIMHAGVIIIANLLISFRPRARAG